MAGMDMKDKTFNLVTEYQHPLTTRNFAIGTFIRSPRDYSKRIKLSENTMIREFPPTVIGIPFTPSTVSLRAEYRLPTESIWHQKKIVFKETLAFSLYRLEEFVTTPSIDAVASLFEQKIFRYELFGDPHVDLRDKNLWPVYMVSGIKICKELHYTCWESERDLISNEPRDQVTAPTRFEERPRSGSVRTEGHHHARQDCDYIIAYQLLEIKYSHGHFSMCTYVDRTRVFPLTNN